MSEKRIRDQLEGMFSNIVAEPEVEMQGDSAPGEATIRPTEAEMAPTQMVPDEPGAVATPAPVPAQPREASPLTKHLSRPVLGSKTSSLASIEVRMTILLVLVAIVPLIAVSAWSLYTLQQANRLATEQSEAAVRELGEAAISQTANATARQVELYLQMHPEIDLANLAQLEKNADLAKIAVQPVGQTGYTAVFDNKGITHFHANPKTVGMDMSTLSEKLPQFWAIFAASLDGSPSDGYYDWEDADKQIRAKYMSIAPVPGTPLRVAATTYIDEFSQPVVKIESQLADIQATARTQLLFALVGIGLVVSAGAFVYGRQFSQPIHQMADAATRVAAGDLSPTGLEERSDEIGTLARVFNSMVVQLRQTLEGLEQRVAERTHVLELAAGVGRRFSTVRDLDTLLQEAVELIQASFDLYHTQVYLTDPAGHYLRLRAGTGDVGAELLRRSHSLPMGPGSISGTAAAEKHAVIVSDTAQSATFLPNPLLPDTRSEMAVPLLVGDQVLGVLDLQSARPGSLTAENLLAFEALAGQLAVAIHNANLFSEAAQARAEVETQIRRLARQDWGEFLDGVKRGEHMGYAYERDSLEPIAEPLVATPTAHVLAMPVQVQGAPIGSIQIEAEADRAWTQAETELVESVARQVGQQAENLRLLAQAEQYRAEAEHASRLLTREGWQAYLEAQAEPAAGFVYDLYQVKPLTDGRDGEPPALARALEVRGEPIGELAVSQAAEVDDQATDLVTAVAERLSAHIENLRLLEETRNRRYELEERSLELEASQRVTFAASETGNPDELLDLVVNLIRDQFDLYHAQVYLVDEEREAAVLRKSTGYAGRQLLEGGHYIPLEQPALVTQAIRQGEPAVVADLGQDQSWRPDPLLPHTRSQMVVPLKVGDKVIGALDVHSRTPGRFTPRTITLFQTMAEQVAMNFESTDLLTRTTEQAEALTRFTNQLRSGAEITERVSAILDLESLLNEVVKLMQSRFGLYHVHIYLLDEVQRELVVRAGSGEVGRVLRERGHYIPLDAEKSLVARAARSQELVLVDDTSLESDFMPNPLLPQTRSEVALPLVAGDKVLGVLDVQDDKPGRFTPADLDTFATLAGQVATSLQNARLFEAQKQAEEAVRESQQRFQGLVETLSDWIWEVNPNGAYTYVSPKVTDLLGYAPEELLGKTPFDLMPPEEAGRVAAIFGPIASAQQPIVALENTNVHKDGHLVVFETNGLPFYDATGQFLGYRGTDRDITERKRAQEAVRESQQMLQLVMNNIPQSIFWKDRNLTYLGCNRNFADDAALATPEEAIGKTDYDMPWVEQAELYRADDSRVMESGEPVLGYEEPQTTPDGSKIWLRTSKVPLRDAAGNVTAVLGMYEDITDRKQAEEAVRESRQRFQGLVETLSDWIWEVNANGVYTYVSPKVTDLLGYEPEEVLGKTPFDLMQPEEAGRVAAIFGPIASAQQPIVALENTNVHKDGYLVAFETNGLPFYDAEGRFLGYRGTDRDITERKQAEEALRENEERFRSIVEHSHSGIFTIDSAFGFTYVNSQMAAIAGYSPEEMIGMDFRKLLTQESLHLVSDNYVRRQRGEKIPDRYEMTFVRKDGERRYGELSASVAKDAAGNVRTLCQLLDITERKQAQEAVRQSQQMLQLVMNNIPQSIFWKDRNLTYLGCNRNFADDAALAVPEEVIGKTDYDMPWLDQAELYRADDSRVMESGEPVLGYEEPQTTPDGSQIWLRTSKVPLHDAEGQVMAVLGMYEDITDRKRAEAERERFTTQLGTAADVATQVSAILDPDILLEAVIPLLHDQFKLYHVHVYTLDRAAGELVLRAGYGEPGRIMVERGHKIPLEREHSLVARAARTKEAVLVNDTLSAPDFMPNPLLPETRSEVAVPLIASGQVLGVFDVQHNEAGHFTEADVDVFTTLAGQIATAFQNAALFNQVERSLEETRVRFEVSQALAGAQTEEEVLDALIQQMGVYPKAQVGIDLIDPGADELTFVVRRNATFDSGLAGHEPGMRFSATQFGLAQRFSPDTPFVSSNTQFDERFDPPSREFARKVGHTSIAILPITAGTEWLGVIGAFSSEEGYFDEQKLHLYQTLAEQGAVALRIARLYDETQRTAERLKEVDRLKGEFLATMSHELRTPLNSILGYSEFLLVDLAEELDSENFEDLQSIHDNSRHLLHLINDILDLTKIEAGRLTLNFEEVEIAPLLDEVRTNNAGLLVNKLVEMTVEVESGLPAICADRVRLSQIMNNLVSNAVKFTEQGQVRLRAFQEDGQVCLEVQDTGVGIESDDLDAIFDKFRQVDGSFTRRAQGTGLGLAITRHLVEMHGGSIQVRSQPGEGSTFTVRLPVQPLEAEAVAAGNGKLNE